MKKISILQKIIRSVRNKVWDKACPNLPKKNYDKAVEALKDYFAADTDIEVKIKSYLKGFNKKTVTTGVEVYETFTILCRYLDVPVEPAGKKGEYTLSPPQIIKKLYELNIISQQLYEEQLKNWPADMREQEYHYYACYYSKGHKPPQAAWLKINDEWDYAWLEFFNADHPMHEGKIDTVHANAFISLKNGFHGTVSLLSLVPDITVSKLRDAERFRGFYCSALTEKKGAPVAGKIIIVKKNAEEHDSIASGEIEPKIRIELFHERLKIAEPVISSAWLEPFTGTYIAYRFLLMSSGFQIRQFSMEIRPDGTCEVGEANKNAIHGYVLHINKSRTALKLGFDRVEGDYNFRVNMILDIQGGIKNFYDGVYSGQRPGGNMLMAGKVRLYKSDVPADSITKEDIVLSDWQRLGERGKEIVDFFWGADAKLSSSNFVHPNLKIFRELYREIL